jgi:hypothetical protein
MVILIKIVVQGFHPGNMQNRRRVWIAEQKAEEQKKVR